MIRFLAAIFRILHQSLRNSPQQILPFTIFFDSSNLLGKLQTNSSWIFTCQRGPTTKRGFCYGRPSVIARAFTTWAAAGDGIFSFCRHHHHHFGRHSLAGSSGGDQSGRINSSRSIIEELARFARSDWMGMSGGDQSWRIISSHSIIEELWTGLSDGDQSGRINSSHSMIHKFKRSDWMGLSGGDQTCQNNFPTCQNNFSTCQNNFPTC